MHIEVHFVIPGDLSDWTQERCGDLQDAMDVGNNGRSSN